MRRACGGVPWATVHEVQQPPQAQEWALPQLRAPRSRALPTSYQYFSRNPNSLKLDLALTPSFFVTLCHHHPYSIALRLIWRRAHGPTHREPPFIPPTEPGNAALVRGPSTRGCVSAGRWHLNRRRCAHVRLHGFDQFRPYGVRTRTARHHIHRCGSVAIVVVAVVVVEVSIQWNLMSASCLVRVASLKARCQRSAHAREHHAIAPARS